MAEIDARFATEHVRYVSINAIFCQMRSCHYRGRLAQSEQLAIISQSASHVSRQLPFSYVESSLTVRDRKDLETRLRSCKGAMSIMPGGRSRMKVGKYGEPWRISQRGREVRPPPQSPDTQQIQAPKIQRSGCSLGRRALARCLHGSTPAFAIFLLDHSRFPAHSRCNPHSWPYHL